MLERFFDKETGLLPRIDCRGDFHRPSGWREHDAVKSVGETIICKQEGGEPWFFRVIARLGRLPAPPEGVVHP